MATMAGKGTANTKMARNAATASATRKRVLRARLPRRMTASTTTASTAALSPKKIAATAGVVP